MEWVDGARHLRLVIEARSLGAGEILGASIALNGACMTLVEKSQNATGHWLLAFEVSPESLEKTNLKNLEVDSLVHLELPLRMGAPLGGHLLSGHVDAVGHVSSVSTVGNFVNVAIDVRGEARSRVAPFLVEKGSIAVDGVSLTVNSVEDLDDATRFQFMLIPHTLEVTAFSKLAPGVEVNLEADLMAKYVNRYRDFSTQVLKENHSS